MNEEGITMNSLGNGLEKPVEPEENSSAEDILRAINPDVEIEKNEEVESEVDHSEDVEETEELEASDDFDVDEEEEENSDIPLKINEPQHETRDMKLFRARDISFMIDEMCAPEKRVKVRGSSFQGRFFR